MCRLAAVSVLLLLSACSSTPPTAVGGSPVTTVTTPAPSSKITDPNVAKLERLNKELASRSVYFDYDDFSIKTKYQPIVKQNAEALKSVPGVAVVLEGNTDERGSSEYNLALGQKRAEVIRKSLVLLGVPDAQIEAISWGKEKPRATCNDERCWSENRRVDFVVKAIEPKK